MGRVTVLLLAIGCGGAAAPAQGQPDGRVRDEAPARPAPSEPAVVLVPEGGDPVRVTVEVAVTGPERERGLMYRRHLPHDAGMLFVFERMEHQSFWMKNTYVPLDMIFVDDRRRVVGVVQDAEPLTEDAREVEGDSQYVLEVNAGFARRHGIVPGTEVRFENVEP